MELHTDENFIIDRSKSGRGRYNYDGKPMTGCTTVCNVQAKPFLITWSASEAYKDCLTLSKDEIKEVLKTKQYAHTKKSDNAKVKGTQAHLEIENFINYYITTGSYSARHIEDEEVATSVNRFIKWAIENKVEFLGNEVSVYSKEHWYAGSFDFICKLEGKLLLGDFKTSKSIDDTYFAQGAGYIIAVEENNPDIKFDGVIIVRSILAKEGQVWYDKSSNGKAKRMENEPFEVVISYNIEREKNYFLSLLNVYKYGRELEIKKWYKATEVEEYSEDDYPISR